MKNFRSMLCILLVLIFTMSLVLGGCGQSKQPENTTPAVTDITNETTSAQEPAQQQLEPVKLTWFTLYDPQEDQDAVFAEANKYIKEKINAEVDFKTLTFSNYSQKAQASIMAGEEFDILWTSNWSLQIGDLVSKKAVIPLDDLLEKYAPKTRAFINDTIWSLDKIDGKIYAIPNYQNMFRCFGIWVKKDLAEKYNFDISMLKNSAADIEPFLKAVKDGEGSKGIIPMAYSSYDMQAFGAFGGELNWWAKEQNQNVADFTAPLYILKSNTSKVVCPFLDAPYSDGYLSFFKLIRDFVDKGYIRKDALSIKDLNSEVKTGKYAMGATTWIPGVDASNLKNYGFETITYPTDLSILNGVQATLQAISTTSKNPERAMMLIDLVNNDKYLYNTLCYGIEGKHYKEVSENRMEPGPDAAKYSPNLNWAMGNTANAYLQPGAPDDLNELIKKSNDEALPDLLPGFSFKNDAVKNEIAAVKQLEDELVKPLYAGALADVEKYFKEYQDRLTKVGIEKIRAEVQKQVEAFQAK